MKKKREKRDEKRICERVKERKMKWETERGRKR